ncbi:carbohydrate esterase family 4 protein [Russula earlei]|uniref:Carbohydrate esterase family 4 protein n=1 Tax=Russula earlei TaxID=71964 RepID=A0ACC0UJY0_9AGAM|nr:carbohydrate esterase family 4 protein [Russula earlei]
MNLRTFKLLAAFLAIPVLAQDHSSEQSEAQITDPNAECTPYSYPPSAQYRSSFPTVWQPATLLASDAPGQALWSKIAGSIPNIPPKGQLNGSTINETYDIVNDPDCWWTAKHCVTPKLAGLPPDVFNIPEPKSMGYGFDDGPNCTHNVFYNYLASQNQKATMFYIGSNVLDWPLEAQRALADGHEICVHTWSHRYMTAFASQDAFAELWYSMQAIKVVTGVTPTCWRPPYGDVDDRIRAIANALGLQTILWQYDSNDWRVGLNNVTAADVDNAYRLFINNSTTGLFNNVGSILLTHELNNFTMQEAINFYPQLKSSFSYLVPVGVALNKTQPYKETNYSLPTFQQYISGQVTVAGNISNSATGPSTGSSSSSSSSSTPSSSSSPSNKNSSVSTAKAFSTCWTFLSAAAMLLFGLGL